MTRKPRSACRALTTATFLCALSTGAAQAQEKPDYPKRPVRLIVAQLAGGNADFVARLLANELGKRLGQQFVVDNRPGGGGIVAADTTVRAPPDGHTLLLVGSSFSTNPSIRKDMPYDPLRDLAPITLSSNAPNILVVNPSLPVRSVNDLIQLARAKPGQLNYGSSATGGSTHLAGELFDLMAKTKMVHIPYKGAAPALIDVMAGQIQLSFASMPSAMAHVRSGKLRAIAVTSAKRSSLVPDLPTISEEGLKGFETGSWQGEFAPRATPQSIIRLLNREIVSIVRTPEIRKALAHEGGEPVGNSPEEFAAWLRADIAKWAKVVKAANIKVE